MGDIKTKTELFHGSPVHKILGDDPENEKDAVGRVRNDEVREDGVGMTTAGTDHP